MYVLLDDCRDLNADIILRNVDAAKAFFSLWQQIDILGLDHDLGDMQPSGQDFLRWMLSYKYYVPHIQLVTSNPVGRENMAADLIAAGYTRKGAEEFYYKE